MNDAERRPALSRAAAHVLFGVGSGIAGTVYGTIVVMATVTAAYGSGRDPWRIAVIVSSTVIVLWVAHLYAHGLSESIRDQHRLTIQELKTIARRELGILLAAVLPIAALLLGAVGVLREASAVWLALAIGLLTLAGEGVRYAHLERLGRGGTFFVVVLNMSLGLLVIALKIAVTH
jgi:hypothetical protein